MIAYCVFKSLFYPELSCSSSFWIHYVSAFYLLAISVKL